MERLKEGHNQSEKSIEARERINRQRVKALEDQVFSYLLDLFVTASLHGNTFLLFDS